uniref:DUF659 domain-containing protein n=1 Tax=Panagrellus redivivus TaxID=6233 RepID=A0A7E4WCX2_PANRE
MTRSSNENNAARGYLHILFRHYKQFQQVIPTLGSHIAALPQDLLSVIDVYAGTDKKYKNVNCVELSRALNKYKNNKALYKAEKMIEAYLNTMVSSSPRKTVGLDNDGLMMFYPLKGIGKTLKIIAGRPHFTCNRVDQNRPRPVVTAYFS